eukprot:TRINITY_DN1003_c0_g1_i3.p1 TRINITY_DN1003_c0_g1~~TRINITY_DN1003_c0_g1_i3.p1  ORF type:complete len:236 (-),score=-33.95 TRINITY_DN1003_c0_g1_i3:79-786(-)
MSKQTIQQSYEQSKEIIKNSIVCINPQKLQTIKQCICQIMYFQHQIITLNNFIFFNLNQLLIKQYYTTTKQYYRITPSLDRITSFLNLNQLIIKQYYTCQNRPFINLTNKVKNQSTIQSSVLIPKNYKPSNNVFLTSINNLTNKVQNQSTIQSSVLIPKNYNLQIMYFQHQIIISTNYISQSKSTSNQIILYMLKQTIQQSYKQRKKIIKNSIVCINPQKLQTIKQCISSIKQQH